MSVHGAKRYMALPIRIGSPRQEEHRPLAIGMTFHMPPLCLKYREFGIGFSETIHVTPTGCERLSNLPRTVTIKR